MAKEMSKRNEDKQKREAKVAVVVGVAQRAELSVALTLSCGRRIEWADGFLQECLFSRGNGVWQGCDEGGKTCRLLYAWRISLFRGDVAVRKRRFGFEGVVCL